VSSPSAREARDGSDERTFGAETLEVVVGRGGRVDAPP
jgi:hypothetical protein